MCVCVCVCVCVCFCSSTNMILALNNLRKMICC